MKNIGIKQKGKKVANMQVMAQLIMAPFKVTPGNNSHGQKYGVIT